MIFPPHRVELNSMSCPRHPMAEVYGNHCAACLLEGALVVAEDTGSTATVAFDIQVPLGETPSASVYLVRSDWPHQLLRLKTWHKVPALSAAIDEVGFFSLQRSLRELPGGRQHGAADTAPERW